MDNGLTREEMWARQQINSMDVDYELWSRRRESIRQMSMMSRGCIFTVDVFKGRYDFASGSFADIFGFKPSLLRKIRQQGDLLEEWIHPDDRSRLIELQVEHSRFIYSLPLENRNNYRQTFEYRMLNRKREYINVVSSQQVIQEDRSGKAWIIMGIMDIAPDQTPIDTVKRSVLDLKTGNIITSMIRAETEIQLTNREKQILNLIRRGFLSKEIAYNLQVSIHTINNHRKNILEKLNVDNAIEAINRAIDLGLIS